MLFCEFCTFSPQNRVKVCPTKADKDTCHSRFSFVKFITADRLFLNVAHITNSPKNPLQSLELHPVCEVLVKHFLQHFISLSLWFHDAWCNLLSFFFHHELAQMLFSSLRSVFFFSLGGFNEALSSSKKRQRPDTGLCGFVIPWKKSRFYFIFFY